MIRRIAVIVTLVVALTLPATRSADAQVVACAGEWMMWTGWLDFPGVPESRAFDGGFFASMSTGTCASDDLTLSCVSLMSGRLAGYRGFATGSGTYGTCQVGGTFEFILVGSTMHLFGQVVGTLNVTGWDLYTYLLHGAVEIVS